MANSVDLTGILQILKELQKASRIQQEQIDKLIKAVEITNNINYGTAQNLAAAVTGVKRKLTEIENEVQEQEAAGDGENAVEKKDHIDKLLEKPSFNDLWNRISIKLKIDDSINGLKQKDKIREILEKACERAKLTTVMNYEILLRATLSRISRESSPDVTSVYYAATNTSQVHKRTCYAHSVGKFKTNMEDFYQALVDPCSHFLSSPRRYLLSESCFSATAQLEFRYKRQRLPSAICCIRKPGFLSFFVADWAYEDKKLPNSSNLNHYTTLKLDKFIKESDLETEEWKIMAAILERAASPSDLNIGSVTMFMHEHRGNIVCAKVSLDNDTKQYYLRIYLHSSFMVQTQAVRLFFDDNGDRYANRIKNNQTYTGGNVSSNTASNTPSNSGTSTVNAGAVNVVAN